MFHCPFRYPGIFIVIDVTKIFAIDILLLLVKIIIVSINVDVATTHVADHLLLLLLPSIQGFIVRPADVGTG